MAQIIPLRPDVYIPLRFELPPFEASEARSDYKLATSVIEFASQARNEIFQRGEPLSDEKRQTLLAMSFVIDTMRGPL